MTDENKNGIDDEIEGIVYRQHAGRKFWLTVYMSVVMFVIVFILLFRHEYEAMGDTMKSVVWLAGLYCGANVAEDFAKGRFGKRD